MYKKLQELMLYIAQKSKDSPAFGYTKLNKILFYSDFYAYGELGVSITGATYIRNKLGPTPKEVKPAEHILVSKKRARVDETPYHHYEQKRLVPLTEPDLSLFSDAELEIVDRVIDDYKDFSGTQLSNETHDLIPWLVGVEGEIIPYDAVFTLKKMPVGYEDYLWAERVLNELEEADPADLELVEIDA